MNKFKEKKERMHTALPEDLNSVPSSHISSSHPLITLAPEGPETSGFYKCLHSHAQTDN